MVGADMTPTPETLREWANNPYAMNARGGLKNDLLAAAAAWEASLTLPNGAIYLGKPTAFWYELLNLSRERGYEDAVDKLVASEQALLQEHTDHTDTLEQLKASEQARQRAEQKTTIEHLMLVIERWLHDVYDLEYKPTPRSTMRWQWCQRPHHPEDDDCAACLRSPEESIQEMDEGCECRCHRRVWSLAKFLSIALAQTKA